MVVHGPCGTRKIDHTLVKHLIGPRQRLYFWQSVSITVLDCHRIIIVFLATVQWLFFASCYLLLQVLKIVLSGYTMLFGVHFVFQECLILGLVDNTLIASIVCRNEPINHGASFLMFPLIRLLCCFVRLVH